MWQMQLLEITVRIHNEPPDQCKEQPGQYEAQGKGQQCPAPLPVHHRGVHVLQETHPSALQMLLHHIAVAILEDGATPHASHAARPKVARSTKGYEKI